MNQHDEVCPVINSRGDRCILPGGHDGNHTDGRRNAWCAAAESPYRETLIARLEREANYVEDKNSYGSDILAPLMREAADALAALRGATPADPGALDEEEREQVEHMAKVWSKRARAEAIRLLAEATE